jgi:hypothetical protein
MDPYSSFMEDEVDEVSLLLGVVVATGAAADCVWGCNPLLDVVDE